MASNIDTIIAEIDTLYEKGLGLATDLGSGMSGEEFKKQYEGWYTVSRRVVAQLLPEREKDFTDIYRFSGNRKEISYDNYRIQDFLHGTDVTRWDLTEMFSSQGRAHAQFLLQVHILESAKSRATSSLMDIKEVLAADLFDNELDKARALHKNKLLREAGVIAGVVLEAHLQKVALSHAVKIAKKDPSISDLNDPLKNAAVYDIPTWRLVQRLGDIRNLCDHNKHRDPTPDEVLEFIDGTDKITKTVY